jgi:hypothetical protein
MTEGMKRLGIVLVGLTGVVWIVVRMAVLLLVVPLLVIGAVYWVIVGFLVSKKH